VHRLPAEWERHEATWLAWPHEKSDWPGKFAPVPFLYAEIVRILSRGEQVRILTPPGEKRRVKDLLKRAGGWNENVALIEARTNRGWTRDYCPLVVKDPRGGRAAVKFRFNGWAKYSNWKKDDAAGELAGRLAGLDLFRPEWNGAPVVLEGGAIDVNGRGALLTTAECLLSEVQQRNPGLGRAEYEALFEGWLGVRRVVWLNRGIAGDDTHGHVDDIARFTSPNTVAAAVEEDRSDANYAPLRENLEILRKASDQAGKPLQVVELPMPRPVSYSGQRLPASYANFYIANAAVLVPTFHDPADRIALNTLARLFPGRDVIGIHCVDMVLGLGTLHCATMQCPA
jgi:agmatine deiminase